MNILCIIEQYITAICSIFKIRTPRIVVEEFVDKSPTYVLYSENILLISRQYLENLKHEFYEACSKIIRRMDDRNYIDHILNILSISLRPLAASSGLYVVNEASRGNFRIFLQKISEIIKTRTFLKDEYLIDSIYSTIFLISELIPTCFSDIMCRSLVYKSSNSKSAVCNIILDILSKSRNVKILLQTLQEYLVHNIYKITVKPIIDVIDVIARGIINSSILSYDTAIEINRLLHSIKSSLARAVNNENIKAIIS